MSDQDRGDEVDGRWIGAVCEYASTCDGPCAELTSHAELAMDPLTQLGYCHTCLPLMDAKIQERVKAFDEAGGYADVLANFKRDVAAGSVLPHAYLEMGVLGDYVALVDHPIDPYCLISPEKEATRHVAEAGGHFDVSDLRK